jgi:hypothetical protein
MSEALTSFAPYRVAAYEIEQKLWEGADPSCIPGFAGMGSEHFVYVLDSHNAAVKFPTWDLDGPNIKDASRRVKNTQNILVRGLGATGLEQIRSSSYVSPAAIVTVPVIGFSVSEIVASGSMDLLVPDHHFERFITTCIELSDRGLELDASSNDIIYSGEGFTVVDYLLNDPEQPVSAESMAASFVSTQVCFSETLSGHQIPKYALRYRNICASMLRGAVELIDADWESHEYKIN